MLKIFLFSFFRLSLASPRREAFQRPDMPVRFSGNRSAIGRAEKFDEIYFGDVVDIAALKGLQLPAGAPVIDGCLAVTG